MFRLLLFCLFPCLHVVAGAITLQNLPAHVRSTHPALLAARLSIDEARGRQLGAGRLSNPEVAFDFRHDNQFREGNVSLSFEQRFPITAKLKLERQITAQLVQAAELEVQDIERKFVAEASAAAIEVLAQQKRLELTRLQMGLMKELSDFVAARVGEGEISALDEAQLKLDSQRLELELRRLEGERVRLLGLLRSAAGSDIEMQGTLPPIGKVPQKAPWEQRADYRMAKLKEEAAKNGLELARARKWEDIGAGVFLEGEKHEDGVTGLESRPFFGFRISLPLPLWNKNEGEVAEKSAGVNRSALETKALASSIRNEVTSALNEMQAAAQLENETREKLLPLMTEQLARLEKAYENGQTDLITVQRTREQRLQAESMLLDAARDFHLARIRYENAIGGNP